ncbi:hypothetical protein EPO34_03775 [Patescibacteria group bacterium]|nr:MAG: hypothetical protein EPO34_03775 [Patescibacteria group bacterium]
MKPGAAMSVSDDAHADLPVPSSPPARHPHDFISPVIRSLDPEAILARMTEAFATPDTYLELETPPFLPGLRA